MGLDHWESYFRTGRLVSCPVGLEPGYTGEIREAWVGFFLPLATQSRLVDICTGNGAVPLIAKETAQALHRTFEIHGVDLARIDPPCYVPNGRKLLAGICFHAGVRAESLPFAASSIDALSGQYALEYTDVPKTLAEVFRVLRSGCGCQFILHHRDSVILGNAHRSLAEASYVLDETKILRRFRRFCGIERDASRVAKSALRDLAGLVADLQAKAAASKGSLTLAYTSDALRWLIQHRGSMSDGELMKAVDAVEGELRSSVRRLQDLLGVAQSEEDIVQIERQARFVGFTITGRCPVLHAGDNLVGWRLNFAKP